MKLVRKFNVREHEEYGTKGLQPAWMPNADPLSGMAAAHDILEHFPGDDGGVEAELQALGACYHVRGEGGYFSERAFAHSATENLAADFPDLLRHVLYEGFTLRNPGRTRCTDVDDKLREVVRKGLKNIRDEVFEDESSASDALDDDLEAYMLGWMRKGYRRAVRRYRKHDAYTMSYFFKRVEEAAETALEHAEEGSIVTITLDMDNLEVSCANNMDSEWE